jgi:hypothetical protein
LTTKIHAACADENTAVALVLSEGQRHDSVPFPAIFTEAAQSGTITRVIADRAYDSGPIRDYLADHGVATAISSDFRFLVIAAKTSVRPVAPTRARLCRIRGRSAARIYRDRGRRVVARDLPFLRQISCIGKTGFIEQRGHRTISCNDALSGRPTVRGARGRLEPIARVRPTGLSSRS